MSDSQLKERFQYLEEQMKQAKDRYEAFIASYHANSADLAKSANEAVSQRAEEERRLKLDPIELIKEIEKMREEGVDEATIRAAFNEGMNEARGAFRIPLKRILKTPDSIPVPAQEDINKMYLERYKGIVDDESGNSPNIAELVAGIRASEEARKKIEEQMKNQKVTVKMYLYRAAYFVLRRPLQFVINFLTAYRDASNQTYRR